MSELWLREDLARAWAGRDAFDAAREQTGEVAKCKDGRRTLRFRTNGSAFYLKYHEGVGWAEIFHSLARARPPASERAGARPRTAAPSWSRRPSTGGRISRPSAPPGATRGCWSNGSPRSLSLPRAADAGLARCCAEARAAPQRCDSPPRASGGAEARLANVLGVHRTDKFGDTSRFSLLVARRIALQA